MMICAISRVKQHCLQSMPPDCGKTYMAGTGLASEPDEVMWSVIIVSDRPLPLVKND